MGRDEAFDEHMLSTFVPLEERNWSEGVGTHNGSGTVSPPTTLPWEMHFNETNLVSVIAYSVLFLIASIGNLTVFITLFRNRQRRSRVNLFIMHLSVADLCVTLIMMPLEIGWHVTVSWDAGDAVCRILMFFRAFGFYLSSFILVTISLDRYFAIARPLSLHDADKRGKLMLILAWLFSVMASVPQSVIFHVEKHPFYDFTQCFTRNFFPTPRHELAYNLFNIICVYVFPLVVIIVSYSLILVEMSKKTKESRGQISSYQNSSTRAQRKRKQRDGEFRRSGLGRLEKARLRTLKMTIVIVSVFIVCWTPYYVISAWYWFDNKSAEQIDEKVQEGLFLFAVSNSCVDPIVYGMFSTVFQRSMKSSYQRIQSCLMAGCAVISSGCTGYYGNDDTSSDEPNNTIPLRYLRPVHMPYQGICSLKLGREIRRCCCKKRDRLKRIQKSALRHTPPGQTSRRTTVSDDKRAAHSQKRTPGSRKGNGLTSPQGCNKPTPNEEPLIIVREVEI